MPRTQNGLFDAIVDWDNLVAAYHRCCRGKRYSADALRFGRYWEEELIQLQQELIWDQWRPRPMRAFEVHRPKKRYIEAPDFRDRVVHHALVGTVEPYFERRFIRHSYACRPYKGTHRAVSALQAMLRSAQRQWRNVYVLQVDVKSFFPSIPHATLMRQVQRTISDPRTLRTWWRTIARDGQDTGLPVGSLTSQLAGNIVLDALDHHIKDNLGVRYYARYMDDAVVLSNSKSELSDIKDEIAAQLATLGLMMHPKSRTYRASEGIDWCGYRTWATHILPRKRNTKAARTRLTRLAERYAAGTIDWPRVEHALASYAGYAGHCDAARTSASLLADVEAALGRPLNHKWWQRCVG